jgi:hypothetical protein
LPNSPCFETEAIFGSIPHRLGRFDLRLADSAVANMQKVSGAGIAGRITIFWSRDRISNCGMFPLRLLASLRANESKVCIPMKARIFSAATEFRLLADTIEKLFGSAGGPSGGIFSRFEG